MNIDGYTVHEPLDRDGEGPVYRATDPEGREVTLRLLPPEMDAASRRRLERELRAAVRIPGFVVTFHTVDVAAAQPYIATPYPSGRTLREMVEESGPLQEEELRRLGRGLASALAAHRTDAPRPSVEPSNVVLAGGVPALVDFGITRAVAGDVAYTAPELLQGGQPTAQADTYALGCVLYYAATGRPPFQADSPAGLIDEIDGSAPDLSRVPAWLAVLLESALAREPSARPTPAAMTANLEPAKRARAKRVKGAFAPDPATPGPEWLPAVAAHPSPKGAPFEWPAVWKLVMAALLLAVIPVAWALKAGRDALVIGLGLGAWLAVASLVVILIVQLRRWRRLAARRRAGPLNAEAARLIRGGHHRSAAAALRRILESLPPDDPQAVIARNNLGVALRGLGEVDAAHAALEDAVRRSSPEVRERVQANMAALQYERGVGGPEALRVSLPLVRRTSVPGKHGASGVVRGNLAVALHGSGRFDEAAEEAHEALNEALAYYGPDSPRTLVLQANLGAVLRDAGELRTAERMLRETFERCRVVLGGENARTLDAQSGLAAVLADIGRRDEALARLREVHDVRTRKLGPGHPATLKAVNNLGFLHLRDGDREAAAALFEDVLAAGTSSEAIIARAREGLAKAGRA
ncbi:serine/threonine-protein kinase [Actinomadura sp. NEAU-AAG7]|uniref:serine/threonine-protein kinase n=1 Tax=Actinomadura sp. NEAU-AAG7 TaxID=2839640 RepID=UPI001BE3E5ED|nr:serine/threonine-protein kinase [Actinomadura sp. NEAU-AAG7]MBT2208860.1 serine/threonine-protein kinase [Actinomadura sp. NEAU-AAG7]